MLIIPLQRPLNRRNFPVLTGLLVLLNLFVFLALQGGDREAREKAAAHYLESPLLDIEWPRYRDYVRHRDPEAFEMARKLDAESEGERGGRGALGHWKLLMMEAHGGFQTALQQERIVEPVEDVYETWRAHRDRYEALLQESFTHGHLLDYDEPAAADLVMHQFMHANVLHLVGNMVFLVALGLLVEGALGGALFIAAYLACGLAAGGASLLVHWGQAGGMLGASGAIAGLMGLFTVLYNRRPVRFFYWVFVYFDYVRKPAIVLLPAWLGWELVQFLTDDTGMVAYEAHIGGLVCGALLGGLVLALGLERRDFLDQDVKREADRSEVKKALSELASLEVDSAKRRLKRLLPRHTDDRELLRTYYAACKVKDADPDLHDAARRILALPARDAATARLARDTASDYLDRLGDSPAPGEGAKRALRSIADRFPRSREADLAKQALARLRRA